MNKGIVRWISENEGFGFIRKEDGCYDIFFNLSATRASSCKNVTIGDQVLFEMNEDLPGLSAKNVMKA